MQQYTTEKEKASPHGVIIGRKRCISRATASKSAVCEPQATRLYCPIARLGAYRLTPLPRTGFAIDQDS